MSKYLGVCCIILSQGIYLFRTLSACLLTLLYLSLSQLNSKFIWILLKLGSMSTSQECPLSNCSIAWNSILVGSLSGSQYSAGLVTGPATPPSPPPLTTLSYYSFSAPQSSHPHSYHPNLCQRSTVLLDTASVMESSASSGNKNYNWLIHINSLNFKLNGLKKYWFLEHCICILLNFIWLEY